MITILMALATAVSVAQPDTTLRITRSTDIEVNTMARSVVLRTGPGDLVRVEGAGAELSGGTLEIQGASPFTQGRGSITITVPTWASVEIATLEGTIMIEDAPERVMAETVNGRIDSKGGRGVISLSTMAGAIHVRDFAGTRLQADAVSGAVVVEGATGELSVTSVSESITLRNVSSSLVSVQTTNGRVSWEGALDSRGRYRFATHNGEIVLHLPEATSARVRGTLFNGSFESDLTATTQGLEGSRTDQKVMLGKEFTATLGKGEASVELQTFNGSIRIRRLGRN